MYIKIAKSFTDYLERQQLISNEDKDIYYYGIERLITIFVNFLLIFFVSFLLKNVSFTIFFSALFFYLRSQSGGVHLKNNFFCVLGSLLIIALLPILKTLSMHSLTRLTCIFFSMLVTVILSPVDNKNHVLNMQNGKYFKIKVFWILIIFLVLHCIIIVFNISILKNLIFSVFFLNAISLLLGKYYRFKNSSIFL